MTPTRSAALRHEIPLAIMDPLLFAEVDGRRVVLTSMLERDRILRALPDAELLDFFAFGWKDLVEGGMSYVEAEREAVARAVRRIGVDAAIVPGDFPLALGDRLREDGVVLTVDDDAVELRRRAKSHAELDGIRAAQRAAEAGLAAAGGLLARARPTGDGRLEVDGKPLLAEDVRAALRAACAEHGAPSPPDVIVASAWSGGGHDPGSGPLPSGLPIVIDLWPRHEASGCWADMTRTFVVGEPAAEHADLITEHARLVRTALERARAAIRPGISGRALFDLVCDLFESAGHLTQRTAQREDEVEGFQFSLGHGVGLEVHEAPALGLAGNDPLVAGDVAGDRAGSVGLADRRGASRGPRARHRGRLRDADAVSVRPRATLIRVPPSVVAAAADAFEDFVDAVRGLGAVDQRVVGMAGAGDRRHQHVEVEVADRLEALDIASRSLDASTAATQLPVGKKSESPVNRQRWPPVDHRNAVDPGVWPGIGMTSRSSSTRWRSENVSSTLHVSDTFAASAAWDTSGASKSRATRSHAGDASCQWLRYWRAMPPSPVIASASCSRRADRYRSRLPCGRSSRKARISRSGPNPSGSGSEACSRGITVSIGVPCRRCR